MSSKGVVSIVKATPNGSRVGLVEMPVDKVVISVLGCWSGEWTKSNALYLSEDAAFTLLSVLEDWKASRQRPVDPELITRLTQRERRQEGRRE